MSKTVLITGATGKQGGSVINALLAAKANFEILAVTRDVQSASAKKLAHKSPLIKLVSGNFDDTEGIFKRAKEVSSAPVWGVFGVQVRLAQHATKREETLTDRFHRPVSATARAPKSDKAKP